MPKIIPICPSCGTELRVSVLHCPNCEMELHNDFQLNSFDLLTDEQADFLISFLRQRGNMSCVQRELGISYPTAKRKLDDLLSTLKLVDNNPQEGDAEEFNMLNWSAPKDSNRASDIVKQKLIEHNGRAIVHTARGLPCEVKVAPDGISFLSNKLPCNPPYRYEVFDVIVDLLISQGGRARKGNGRNCKLGEPDCDETTVVGAIGYSYAHKKKEHQFSIPCLYWPRF